MTAPVSLLDLYVTFVNNESNTKFVSSTQTFMFVEYKSFQFRDEPFVPLYLNISIGTVDKVIYGEALVLFNPANNATGAVWIGNSSAAVSKRLVIPSNPKLGFYG